MKFNSILTNIKNIVFLLLLLLYPQFAIASDIENLAKSLAEIRSEVETLQMQLDVAKEQHGNQMAALSSQLADLSVEERRQKITIEKLQNSIDKISEHTQQSALAGEKLKPVLIKTLAVYKRAIHKGFPFKIAERLKVVDELEKNIINDLVDPRRAANQLWAMFEDEIRLSKENGIYQQTITLEGEQILADIAKIGTVFLFFQTKDNRSGMAKKLPDKSWKFVTAESSSDQERIAKLFDSLKKQIRQGYYELPNPWKI